MHAIHSPFDVTAAALWSNPSPSQLLPVKLLSLIPPLFNDMNALNKDTSGLNPPIPPLVLLLKSPIIFVLLLIMLKPPLGFPPFDVTPFGKLPFESPPLPSLKSPSISDGRNSVGESLPIPLLMSMKGEPTPPPSNAHGDPPFRSGCCGGEETEMARNSCHALQK